MNTSNIKNISVALLITLGAIFSINANAAETSSIENSLSEMLIAQGQQVMVELSEQLQQSVSEEINSFSVDFTFDESMTESLAWISDEQTTKVTGEIKQSKQTEINTTTENKLL
jgi:hypothetical protein